MPAEHTSTEHDDWRASEDSSDAQPVRLSPDAADFSDGPDARDTSAGAYPRSTGTEEAADTGQRHDFEEPDLTDEAADTGQRHDFEEPDLTDEAAVPAGDDQSRERLVGEPLGYRSRWDDIQAGFVDEPRRSVADADALVAEVIDEITAAFASARADLEAQWSQGDEASTEDLRQAFRRYRSFFQRLLST